MNTNLPTDLAALRALPYTERMAALRERTATVLDPQTDQERNVVDWLGKMDPPTLSAIVAMVERARAEALAWARAEQGAGRDPELWGTSGASDGGER